VSEEEVSISPLCLQKLVTREEIDLMRELRKKGLTIPKIARIVKRSPSTCRHCRNLRVLGTGSQIILICTVTKRFKNYEDPCDCGCFQRKEG